ncbi:hypothetical protein FACS1894172_00830 [Spirochaetia bacterium]|nr:hypothetical protein FACS1894172_00830 [Spirochaetia bacterium]
MENNIKNCIMDFLELINKYEQEINGNIFNQNKNTNDKEIDIFKKWLLQYYEKDCYEYIDVIKIINGFTFNTVSIYSLNVNCLYNIYKSNETLWNDNKKLRQYIFFATDEEISLYGLNIKNRKYCRLDIISNNILEEYETFNELMLRILEVSLYTGDSGFDEEYEKIKRKYNIL